MEVHEKKKAVNGVDLVWSPEHEMYMLPMPQTSKFTFLFDEQHGAFLPVLNPENMVMREREATAPDGTRLRETVVFRQPDSITELDVQNQRNLVTMRRLQWQAETWESIVKFRPMFVMGFFVTIIFFFYNVILAMNGTAALVGLATGTALAELSYYAVWGLGILAAAIVIRYAVPAILNSRSVSFSSGYESPVSGAETTRQSGDVVINVQQGNGLFGSQSEAQRIVTNRDL